MFDKAENVVISGGTFTAVYGNKTPLDVLYKIAAPGAFHISDERFDAPKCHPDTRVAVIEDLMEQITTALVSCLLWLYGAAGAGKSSIAQTIAEQCSAKGLLIGSFFFFRASPLRNNAKRLVASLVYQLARTIPSTLPYIAAVLADHPAIFDSSLKDQLQMLFVEPLRQAHHSDPQASRQRRLLILDGLDECDQPKVQQQILAVLGSVFHDTPVPIVVLIASRPESHITATFKSPDAIFSIPACRIGLNDKYDAEDDLRLYLQDKFHQIKRTHPFRQYLPKSWPASQDIETIVQKSSGQFIFAATVIRYVGSDSHIPHDRLRDVISASHHFASHVGNSPFKELDALYLHILSGVEDVILVLAILYCRLVYANDPFEHGRQASCPRTIATRLRLSLSDVHMYISRLSSLIKYKGEDKPILIFHASLEDFLIDQTRSGSFYIRQPAVYTVLSKGYLRRVLEPLPGNQLPVDALRLAAQSLALADFNQDLSAIVADMGTKVPQMIDIFQSAAQEISQWDDHEAIMVHTSECSFWNQCLSAIHDVFKRDLLPYFSDRATHEFLAVMAFVDLDDKASPVQFFVKSFGEIASPWGFNQYQLQDGLPRRPYGPCSQILQEFLTDPAQSGKLAITPKQFARAAMKCRSIMTRSKRTQNSSLWAVFGLISLLPWACGHYPLIRALKGFDCRSQGLEKYPQHSKLGNDAIRLYLELHATSVRASMLLQPFKNLLRLR